MGDDSNQFAMTFNRFLFAGARTSTELYGFFFPGRYVGKTTVQPLGLQTVTAYPARSRSWPPPRAYERLTKPVSTSESIRSKQMQPVALALEGYTQPEFDLSRRTERVDACSYPNAVYVMPGGSGSIDLSRGSRQQSV
jgi:hypothetical protein